MSQPNILFVFPDQLSARWVESQHVHTPHLDQFATHSTVFNHAYTCAPVCTPYRACLLTGRYPSQTGVTRNGMALPADTPTIADHLNAAGYNTYYIGKWHLSGDPHRNRWVPPQQRGGFSHFTGWESHHVDHWQGHIWRDDPETAYAMNGHETDGLTTIVLDQLASGLEEPFCLFVSYQAPHPPCSPPAAYREPYRNQSLLAEPNADLNAYYDRPEWEADYDVQEFRERYYGEITQIDAAFGEILAALDEHQLADKTCVVFTSDHGEMNGAQGLFGKGVMYDEAMRVPLLVRVPGQQTGYTTVTPVSTVDFLPTLLEVADITSQAPTEGRSLVPLLTGKKVETQPVFSEYGDYCCIIQAEWKLIANHATLNPLELYHLTHDPYELENRLISEPNVIQQLSAHLARWQSHVTQIHQD